jgi:hypothetical protein
LPDPKDVDILKSELENRLDHLFCESDGSLSGPQENRQKKQYPLAELKNLILSIDWEITDEVLDKLILQIRDLQVIYQDDKIVMTFLKILNLLGKYIKAHRAKAHPRTFKILNSVFANLDKVVLSNQMSESTKKQILREEMQRYAELRNQIAKGKKSAAQARSKIESAITEVAQIPEENIGLINTGEPEPRAAIADNQADPFFELEGPSTGLFIKKVHPEPGTTQATLAAAVEEIKSYIHNEIKALKKEIHSMKEQGSA